MKALFVESGLELRILTNQFIKNYFKEGIIITTAKDQGVKIFAEYRKIPVRFVMPPDVPEARWHYAISQIQKIRLLKKLGSKTAIKLSEKYQNLCYLPDSLIALIFNVLHFISKVYNRARSWPVFEKALTDNQVDEIIFAGYTGKAKRIASALARKKGVNTYVIQNSWKDLFIDPYLQFQVDKMNVWSKPISLIYQYLNPESKKTNWIIEWHPRLEELIFNANKETREKETGIILLYTCANSRIVPHEHYIVERILKTIDEDVHVIIRPNPQELHFDSWKLLTETYSNCSIDYPDWFWDEQTKINVPKAGAEERWFNTLHACNLVVNIASTVTVEALLLKKSVINIAFGPDGNTSDFLSSLTYLPYYEALLSHPNVLVCDSLEKLKNSISTVQSKPFSGEGLDQFLISSNGLI